jgi:hypothetical protein
MGIIKEVAEYPFYKKAIVVVVGSFFVSLPVITALIASQPTQIPARANLWPPYESACISRCQSDEDCPLGTVCNTVTCRYCGAAATPSPTPIDPCADECILFVGINLQSPSPSGECPDGFVCKQVKAPIYCSPNLEWVNRCVPEATPTPTAIPTFPPLSPTPTATPSAPPSSPTPIPSGLWPTESALPLPIPPPPPPPWWQFWKYLF